MARLLTLSALLAALALAGCSNHGEFRTDVTSRSIAWTASLTVEITAGASPAEASP